jgi:transposase-like protein
MSALPQSHSGSISPVSNALLYRLEHSTNSTYKPDITYDVVILQGGQVIDILVSARRDADAARRFFHRAMIVLKVVPVEVVTDAAAVYPRVLDELVPAAWHHVERWANNRIEADHSRLKHRLRPMRGLRTDRTATVIIAGLAFLQNLRRGHYELAVDLPGPLRIAAAFTELARAI